MNVDDEAIRGGVPEKREDCVRHKWLERPELAIRRKAFFVLAKSRGAGAPDMLTLWS